MTIEHLRQLHQQADPATPAPWRASEDGRLFSAPGYEIFGIDIDLNATSPDAELIAAMRNDLPHLLDIAEAARRLCATTTSGRLAERDNLREALDRLETT